MVMKKSDFLRWSVIIATVTGVLFGVFPPWSYTTLASREGAVTTNPAGYHLIASPPRANCENRARCGVEIDITRLSIQWVALGVLVGGVVFLTRRDG